MSTPYQLSLLRRTLAAIAAAAFVFTASDAAAQGNKIKLNGGTKSDECEFSSMSITPSGGVSVQCSGTTTPPPDPPPQGQSISVSPSSMQVAKNTAATLAIKRNNGNAGAYLVFFQLTGAGCAAIQPQPAVVQLTNNGPTSVNFAVAVGAVGTTCEVKLVQLSPQAGATGANIWFGQETALLTVVDGPPPPEPPVGPPGCPAPPQNMLQTSFGGLGNPVLLTQASGQIVSIPLPSMPSSGQVTFGESPTASSPQPVTLEISINRCPGVIDTDTNNRCNIRSTNGNYNSITWLTKAYVSRGGTIDSGNANEKGLCWTGSTEEKFVNARWTYSSCGFGSLICGFAAQVNLGGY